MWEMCILLCQVSIHIKSNKKLFQDFKSENRKQEWDLCVE